MPEVVVWYKAVVGSSTSNDELGKLVCKMAVRKAKKKKKKTYARLTCRRPDGEEEAGEKDASASLALGDSPLLQFGHRKSMAEHEGRRDHELII